MHRTSTMLAVCFCAGVIGALFNSLAVWAAGHWGITTWAGVRIAPALTMDWLCQRLVWGGIWGLAYFLFVAHPRSRRYWIRKGLWISLLPAAFQLFYYFPRHTSYGSMGLALGTLTPLFILLFTAIWGLFTGLFSRALWGH